MGGNPLVKAPGSVCPALFGASEGDLCAGASENGKTGALFWTILATKSTDGALGVYSIAFGGRAGLDRLPSRR
jgi:hypothetical protein